MIDSIGAYFNPTVGILSIPLSGLRNRQNFGMRPREILANNLKLLMATRPGLDTLKKVVAASDGRLSNGKLDRIRRGASTTDIDTLYEIAETFDVQPWQLLVENLDPRALPVINDVRLLQQIKALVSIPQTWDGVNPDRAGNPYTKALPDYQTKIQNESDGA